MFCAISSILIAVYFTPELVVLYKSFLLQELDVICSAETADILLSNDGHVYFKQTCVGTPSTQTYKAKNISRMPLEFRWNVPGESRNLIRVEPETGVLMPNEEQVGLRQAMCHLHICLCACVCLYQALF